MILLKDVCENKKRFSTLQKKVMGSKVEDFENRRKKKLFVKIFSYFSASYAPRLRRGLHTKDPNTMGYKLRPTGSRVILINVSESGLTSKFSTIFFICSYSDENFTYVIFHYSIQKKM